MLNKLIGSAIVISGMGAIALSSMWGIADYAQLVKAMEQVDRCGCETAMFRANTHRINVGFEGTWIILGGILTATGFVVAKK